MDKQRIDLYLVEKGYAESRSKAQSLIMAGQVLINEKPVDKPSQLFVEGDVIRVKESLKYVSRGALKLEKAIEEFKLDVKDKSFIDFGSSTGGFTDVLLQNGAKHVSCIDVGYGQLAWKIRNDDRVSVYERTNARYLTPEMIDGLKDAAVCDVSFISVCKILPAMDICTKDNALTVILIKPQFEAGKEQVGKKGIVRDKKIHIDVIEKVIGFMNENTSFAVQAVIHSPITGQKGNIEYLLLAQKGKEAKISQVDIKNCVSESFNQLQ